MAKFSNPDAFNYEAAAILAKGYESFPIRFDWKWDDDNEFYPTKTGNSRQSIQAETISWLTAHGYLHKEKEPESSNRTRKLFGPSPVNWSLALTPLSLSVLQSIPSVLDGRDPLGKRIATAVGKNSLSAITQLIPLIFQKGVYT